MEFDIRKETEQNITVIRIAEEMRDYFVADSITRSGVSAGVANIRDTNSGGVLSVRSIQHCKDLIKGLEKAMELGWIR